MFVEAGTARDNIFRRNLMVDTRGPTELTVTNATMARGEHAYWMYAGNVNEGNVAIGVPSTRFAGQMTADGTNKPVFTAEVGHGILVQSALGPYTPTVATDLESYGFGKYGMWARGVITTFERPITGYNAETGILTEKIFLSYSTQCQGGVACSPLRSPYEPYTPTTINDPTMFFNGKTGAVYPSAFYFNTAEDAKVVGGLALSKNCIHSHYESRFKFEGTKLRCEALLDPSYWAIAADFNAADINVTSKLFPGWYGSKTHQSPGLVRINGSTLTIGGTTQTNVTAAYTSEFSVSPTGFTGTVEASNGRKLSATPPPTGYLKLPSTYVDRNAYQWVVHAVGQPAVPAGKEKSPIANPYQEDLWQVERSLGYLGYFHGFPPAQYDIDVYRTSDGSVVRSYQNVTVTSGQVTQLPQ